MNIYDILYTIFSSLIVGTIIYGIFYSNIKKTLAPIWIGPAISVFIIIILVVLVYQIKNY